MDLYTYSLFSVALILIPGPNVLVIISTSLVHGRIRGFQTVAGTSIALVIQLTAAALGTGWFIHTLSNGFLWLKWTGVSYLAYLGIQSTRHFLCPQSEDPMSSSGSFLRGFWTSLTNPKTIAFFAAFLPQFVSQDGSYLPQIALLSLIFLCLAFLLDTSYVLVASQIGKKFKSGRLPKFRHGISAFLYFGASLLIALTKMA